MVQGGGGLRLVDVYVLLDSRSELTFISEALAAKLQQEVYDGPIVVPLQGNALVSVSFDYVRSVEWQIIPMHLTLTKPRGNVHFRVPFLFLPSVDDLVILDKRLCGKSCA